MSDKSLSSPSLEKAHALFAPNTRIAQAIHTALEELRKDAAYAADELVVLAEELLNQLAAIGFVKYINSDFQKEMYNDFILELFNSSGHDYNAGPLFRWAANMIRENSELKNTSLYGFFWENLEGKEVLNTHVQHLAELRNQVMHGFFVLPPEKNRIEAELIGKLILSMHKEGIFSVEANYHFCNSSGFTGHWNIQSPNQWNDYMGESAFGKLCERIVDEQNERFWETEESAFNAGDVGLVPSELKAFITEKSQGAFACWVHPLDVQLNAYFAGIGNWLKNSQEIVCIGYSLHETGLSFTGDFLLRRLKFVLNNESIKIGKDKKLAEQVAALRKNNPDKKIVVLINRIHLALFSPQHVTKLTNFLYENKILLVAIGHHYEHFNPLFNQSIEIQHPASLPDNTQKENSLPNYLRFKGPFHDRKEDAQDITLLHKILDKLCKHLANGEEIYARRFAEDHDYPMEYVHEIFALLYPWVKTKRSAFEEDIVDELYGFPTKMTEVTPIYLALGRRDVKLEYQHKVISLK